MVSGAQCTYADLESINVPDFLETDMNENDIVIAGMNINLFCKEDGKMLPFEVDQDSNFVLEVYCVDGEFQAPLWPAECVGKITFFFKIVPL